MTTLTTLQADSCNSLRKGLKHQEGQAVALLVDASRYKPEGRGFYSRWSYWIFFYSHNPSGRTMSQGPTQLLKEMSTRNNLLEDKGDHSINHTNVRLNVSIFLKSRSLNFLEPSGTVQDYRGIAFYFT